MLFSSNLADATDERLAKIAEDFLEEHGSRLWPVGGRGPVYPGHKETKIKPTILKILELQRQNQSNNRAAKQRNKAARPPNDLKRHVDGRGKLTNSRRDVSSRLMAGHLDDIQASNVIPTASTGEGGRGSDQGADPNTPAAPLLFAQPAPSSEPLRRPVVHAAQRTHASNTTKAASFRAHSVPAINSGKRSFEQMVASPAPTTANQSTSSHKRPAPENAFLARRAESGARVAFRALTVEIESSHTNSTPTEYERLNTADLRNLDPIGLERSIGQRAPKTVASACASTHNDAALRHRFPRTESGIGHSGTTDRHPGASHAGRSQSSNKQAQADSQAERSSYDILSHNYSMDLKEFPGFCRFILTYVEEKMLHNRLKMHEGATAEERRSGRDLFFAFRELLNVVEEEGCRRRADLNY